MPDRLNVADRLAEMAHRMPGRIALACPAKWSHGYQRLTKHSGNRYATITYADLDADATTLARGFVAWGVTPGTRLAMLVRPGIEFVTLVFALLRAGAVMVLVDAGLGRKNIFHCLSDMEPQGFVAISAAQALRTLMPRRFRGAKWNVTVGRRWFWGGLKLEQLRELGAESEAALPETHADDPAAIVFTSGSTGPPKGVLYHHRTFATQASEIAAMYGIEPGGVDLACFPLFGLFNVALGVTTVFPEMDFSRPASADPERLLAAAHDWQVTQAFASPAVWDNLSRHCEQTGQRIDSLREVFSCGAPVPASVLQRTLACVHATAHMHTPYGATESLPVATIEAQEVLSETAAKTATGSGVCVGRKFDMIDWRIIRITDEPIKTIGDAEELPAGEVGELIVRGPQVSLEYVKLELANVLSKNRDGDTIWHRMGDVGYFDEQQRFWYCGRQSQRVETAAGPLYTECVEAVFNTHANVRRTALVGIGERGAQTPVVIVELERDPIAGDLRSPPTPAEWPAIEQDLHTLAKQHFHTQHINHFLLHEQLPVDIRHNSKIFREQLAEWAAERLKR
ncbi:MAG: fatty acid CoA ligase family protein [Pirellulales bacterium]